MALKIDEQSADALTFRIAQGLHGITDLFFGLHHMDFDWAESVGQSLPEALQDRLTKICGEGGLSEFLYGQVLLKLDEDSTFDSSETNTLHDTESYRDALGAAKELVSQLAALPYSYRLVAPLPSSFSKEFFEVCDDFELGPGISLVRGKKLAQDFSLETGNIQRDKRIISALGAEFLVLPDKEGLYFVQQRSGYVGQQQEPPILAEFKTALQQLLGAILAIKGFAQRGWRAENEDRAIFIHRRVDDPAIVLAERLSPKLRDFYGEMSILQGRTISKKTKEDNSVNLRKLNIIKSVFQLNDHGRRLSVAAIWYLRSHISKDSLDGLLESTIALEALLGGGNAEGTKLSSLLGNRCAFLVGRSITDRQEILSKFSEIYTLRSRIVHEGHHRFTKFERELLTYSRELCRRALVKEMTMTTVEE
ncbi:HEPN domain-containing protein [Novosphingobium resinovorum]|uniref:HEPN domain-containing protein n=1 Tax=Novosphingobium TaxID=165696 RepID=UPI001B3C5288|nr:MULTISPECIES: HEPN domain-containing protein [Novosphingobium]MBF7010332.1 hypothetical protein [Novosphingobium sp. HR1a]WJM28338.1 HEPN domain-containing protein [Novosphingobium resinovorum]